MKKKPKLPPYVDLAIIKMRDGVFDDMEAVTDIICNNLTKRIGTKNHRIVRWHHSILKYWQWVLKEWVNAIYNNPRISKTDKKVFKQFLEMRLNNGSKRKSD